MCIRIWCWLSNPLYFYDKWQQSWLHAQRKDITVNVQMLFVPFRCRRGPASGRCADPETCTTMWFIKHTQYMLCKLHSYVDLCTTPQSTALCVHDYSIFWSQSSIERHWKTVGATSWGPRSTYDLVQVIELHPHIHVQRFGGVAYRA